MNRPMVLASAGLLTACLATLQPVSSAETGARQITRGGKAYDLYPATFQARPDVPSPYRTGDGLEVLTACTEQQNYVLVPVTITPGITVRPWEAPLEIDREDFPSLATTGRHSEAELDQTRAITGRSLAEITELGRPGRLSSSGFMAGDEDILSVLKGDNRLVTRLGLTHPELARPILHVCNPSTSTVTASTKATPTGGPTHSRLPSCSGSGPSRRSRPRFPSNCTKP